MKLKRYFLAVVVAVLCFIPTFAAWAGTVNLPQTGQTSCWDASGNGISCTGTGQDADKKAGVAWPSPRFTDNSDQTMTDNLTGLMWTKDAGTPTVGACTGGKLQWTSALDYITCLNNANYLGHNDWRLPNVLELQSLVNSNVSPSPAAWLNSQGYGNTVQLDYYWSSTTINNNNFNAWVVNMDYGYVTGSDAYGATKSDTHYVWPVRAGQVGNPVNLSILKSGTGTGTVTSPYYIINCGNICSATYNQSITTTLTATANTGSTFTGWSGAGCSGTGTCTLTSSAAATVTATFTLNPYTVTPSAGAGGTISPSTPQIVAYGATTQFTVTPNKRLSLPRPMTRCSICLS
ncbi:MAG: DUF1566 domain-containing protein [Nitrospirae bacterium]|nr:DUF1566 domain-containing protein [Nitrospirota bacterium]